MESWRTVFRHGFAPHLPTAGLEALRLALASDDPRVIQGVTAKWTGNQVESACPVGFACWQGNGLETIAEVQSAFGLACVASDQALGEVSTNRYFLNTVDAWTREELIANLLPELDLILAERQKEATDRPAEGVLRRPGERANSG